MQTLRNRAAYSLFLSSLLGVALPTLSACTGLDRTVQPGRPVLTIGVILPLTGAAAQYGQNCRKGIALAVDEVNADPQAAVTLRTVLEDDRTEPKDSVAAFSKLITIDSVPLVIGPLPSSNAMAAAPLANEHHVVLLSPGASTPRLTQAGPYVFRNWQSDASEGGIMAAYLRKNDVTRVAILAVNNDFGVALRDYFSSRFASLGGQIVASDTFAQDATDFRAQLTAVRSSSAQALYLLSYPRETGTIVKQARQLAVTLPIYGVAAMEDPSLLTVAGTAADGIVYTKAVDPSQDDPVAAHFQSAFAARYREHPGLIADTGYDAVLMVSQAARNANSLDGPSLAAALGAIRDFHGASGLMSFDANGDIVKPIGIKRILDGSFVWLDRAPGP